MPPRDYDLSTAVPPPVVALGHVEMGGKRLPVYVSEEWRIAWFENVGVALFGVSGGEDILLDVPQGAFVETINGDASNGLTVSGTPGPGYTVSMSLSRNISADGAKLDGIAPGATANETNAFLQARSNHTGTQAISTVIGLQSALDGKAASVHGHAIANITGLQSALDGKSATGHGHSISNVTGLQAALDGKVNTASIAAITTDMSSDAFADELKSKVNEIIATVT